MADGVVSALRNLERHKTQYGDSAGERKLEWLQHLARRRLPRAGDVRKLHETLLFLRAYPDDAAVLDQVETMLDGFGDRGDLRRHGRELRNSGIAGTTTSYPFFPATAAWLAPRFGAHLSIVWDEFDGQERLEELLPQLALYCETPALDAYDFGLRRWIERLRGPQETDAAFILQRLAQLPVAPAIREALLAGLGLPLALSSRPGTPARTRERTMPAAIAYQRGPLQRAHPSRSDCGALSPRSIRALAAKEARTFIDLACAAMVSRGRELEAFIYGDPNDVRMVECGSGLQFAYIGMVPQRRLLLETLYGFLMLKNGVVVGYGSNASLFKSSEVAFTVFDTYRGGETAAMYGQVIGITRALFGADTLMVDPYQLGLDNDDAIRSGAWWFYHKLGFRPRAPELRRLMQRELQCKRADPAHRSSAAALRKLGSASVFLHLRRSRADVLGVLPLANVGLHVTRYLAERFGHDRRRAARHCAEQSAALLGLRSPARLSAGERLAWERWGPLVMILPGVESWSRRERQALGAVIRAKGGRRESDYVQRFDRHRRLRQALVKLARIDLSV